MAVTPTLADTPANVLHQTWFWEAVATGETINSIEPTGRSGELGTVQAFGTFGGATITLEGSNDGSTFVTLRDTDGADVSFTAAGYAEISTAFRYIRVASTGGTSDDVDVYLCLRG